MPSLSHLKSFQALEAALRAGSLKDAATELAITPAAVGQRIKALEDYLGVDLLVRGRSGLAPTPALADAIDHLRRAFRALEAAAEALDLQRGHEIHIAAVSDFAELWLKPRLSEFLTTHPNILFCINGEGETPLRLGAVDCEITFAAPPDAEGSDLLFADYVAPISSPENTRRISTTRRRDRLEGFPLLHLDFYRNDPAVPGWPRWISAHKLRRTAPERGMRFQRIEPVLDAVLADAGLAICGLALIVDAIDRGTLSLPFGVGPGAWTGHAFQARFRSDALQRPQVRRFRAWLQEQAHATSARLHGLVAAATPAVAISPRAPRRRRPG
ncbi:MAG: LysR substrate-binding domain-containing protein [Pseudomonadales bacterium]